MIDRIRQFIENIGHDEQAGVNIGQSIFLEAENNGFLPHNTASVKVKAFNDRTKSQRLNNISVQWFRHFEGRNYAIDNVEDSYNFTCEDIGSKIVAVITDNDRPTVYDCLTFGPVSLDPQCRVDLEQTFKSGRAIFEVQLPYKRYGNELLLRPPQYKDPSKFIIDELVLTPETLTIVHSRGIYTNLPLKNLSFESVSGFPLLVQVNVKQEDLKDLDFFEIRSLPSNRYWFYVKFFNRVMRENFVMLTKLFAEVKAHSYANQLAIWEARVSDKGFFSNRSSGIAWGDSSLVGDLLLQLNVIQNSLQKSVQYTKAVAEERDSLIEYSEGLERDLKATLKDLKEIVVRQKLQDQIDLSRIDKVEVSIADNEQLRNGGIDDRSRLNSTSLNAVKIKKLQDENEILEKQNHTLAKELNAFKQKRKEKFKSINNSIDAINRELNAQAENLNGATNESLNMSLDVSKFLEQVNEKSLVKKKSPVILEEEFGIIRETKNDTDPISPIKQTKTKLKTNSGQIQDEISELAQKKIDLENQINRMESTLVQLKAEIEAQILILEAKKNEDKMVHPYLEAQFQELRRKISNPMLLETYQENEKKSLGSEVLDYDFNKTLMKTIKANRMELLNIENEALSLRVGTLITLIRHEQPEKEATEILRNAFNDLSNQISALKSESERLTKEITSIEKSSVENEKRLRDQLQTLKGELDGLSVQNAGLLGNLAQQSDQEIAYSILKEELRQKEAEATDSKAENATLLDQITQLTDQISHIKEENKFLNAQLSEKNDALDQNQETICKLQEQVRKEAELSTKNKQFIQELNDKIAQYSSESQTISEKTVSLERRLEIAEQEKLKLEEIVIGLNNQLREKEKVLLRSLETNKKLAEEVDRLQASQNLEDGTRGETLKDV